jgi:hypothetical protein
MGSRPYHGSQERQVKTRRQIKAQMIRQKNKFWLNPECVVGGDVFCDAWPSDTPLVRADVLFFHTTQNRYFFAHLVTAKRKACEMANEWVSSRLDEMHPFPEEMWNRSSVKTIRNKHGKVWGVSAAFSKDFTEACGARDEATPGLLLEKSHETQSVALQWKISDVDAVSAYIDTVVDATVIDEAVIRKFVKDFRDMGEPYYPGVLVDGATVDVPLAFITNVDAFDAP